MKKTINILIVTLLFVILSSCQDVINVDLKTSKERLVIEALINWEEGTTGANQFIKLSKTSSFYNNAIVPVDNANVLIKNLTTLQEFDFILNSNGIYQTITFIPEIDTDYELEISYNGSIYKATAKLLASPVITEMTQSIDKGFSDEEPEVNIKFQDFINQENFYKINYTYNTSTGVEMEYFNEVVSDNFLEDSEIELYYEDENFIAGDEIKVTVYNIPAHFFDFLTKLELQEEGGEGPFSSSPINVKGNIINTTNIKKYPYGYFSLNKITPEVYIFQ